MLTKKATTKNSATKRSTTVAPSKKTTRRKQVEKVTTLPISQDGDAHEVFIDGISGLMPGYPNSKLSFYVTVDSANGEEIRKNNLRLTMSTVTMLELFDALGEILVDNLKEVEEIAQQQQKKLAAFSAARRKG